jgi:CBS domain-containing protein
MKAADIMTRKVITVGPDSCVQDTAKLLLENGISAAPVVDGNGDLVGIISEGDLMRRPEAGTERRRSWWLDAMANTEFLADEYVRSHSRRVADVMTRKVIAATPETPVRDIAHLLEKNGVKRVPVVEGSKVVGIVSRANLLHALASLGKDASLAATPDDGALRERVMREIEAQPWAHTALVNVIAHDGTVDLWGMVETNSEKKAMRIAAELIPGVRAVNDNLMVRSALVGT